MDGKPIVDFPTSLSFTITNRCNLRCRMCGQWSEEGYIRGRTGPLPQELGLADWKRLVDEAAEHGVGSVLLRGGEPFMQPWILDLVRHIRARGMFTSIDTNGTYLDRYAEELVQIGQVHVTVSMDGPEEVHDRVRGVKGTFRKAGQGLLALAEAEKAAGRTISKSLTFTISGDSFIGLSALPGIARSLSVGSVCIVPFYYVPEVVGREYEREMQELLGCRAYSWRGFHHEASGVDPAEFEEQLAAYRAALGDVHEYPYFQLTPAEFRTWFTSPTLPVGKRECPNVEHLIDIQPNGDANFCTDFPDYTFGNVRTATIAELWNGPAAARFRAHRRKQPLAVCHRCGAKYMGEVRTADGTPIGSEHP